MSTLNELIEQIDNPDLRKRIADEVTKLNKQKKFGLVFEEHLPECTPLYDIPVKKGSQVTLKSAKKVLPIYTVMQIENGKALCKPENSNVAEEIPVENLVTIAKFGEPIYPYLKPLDSVCNAPDSELWHTLIEADNYHALQLLEYLYAGKVDCIYIDPPYNTGARDWKYNNDYVDSSDEYRHSRWLSMMQKRLQIAKKLLNPNDSVLIITIDEKEYLHLGCLLEEMFPEASIQMVSSVINPKGVASISGFKRADEYIFFVMMGSSSPVALPLSNEWSASANKVKEEVKIKGKQEPGWTSMMRRGSHSSRIERPGLYYSIFVNPQNKKIIDISEPIPKLLHKSQDREGLVQVLPIRTDGSEGCWQVGPRELRNRIEQGRIRLGKETSYGFVINYLPDGEYAQVISGDYSIEGHDDNGALIAYKYNSFESRTVPPTQWKIASHDASAYGSSLLLSILNQKVFSFPKSLYAEHDTINFFVANKPNALIVDFFAGSGTTLHAVNLLNAEDGGHRRCILVTNNEVSEAENKELTEKGFKPGDEEWDKLGIARYVTWPRTVCSIEGHDVNGNPLKGNYIGSDIPMADGFKANANFFKLGFLDKTRVSLGMQFAEMLPTLWMKAGAIGECPSLDGKSVPEMLILPNNKMAILNNENQFAAFAEELAKYPEIETVYLVTDYEASFVSMTNDLSGRTTYQLYRDYLDNFRINAGRNAR